MKIRSVGAELLRAGRLTEREKEREKDRQTDMKKLMDFFVISRKRL
jgi:hypothetical protein